MFPAELFDCLQHLFDLVRFREAFLLLDVDPGIARPGHPIDPMTGPALPRRSEVSVAYGTQVAETNPSGVAPHGFQDLRDSPHL